MFLVLCLLIAYMGDWWKLQFDFYFLFDFFIMMQVWLEKTLQKLDSLLLGVCQEFKQEGYITVSVLIF